MRRVCFSTIFFLKLDNFLGTQQLSWRLSTMKEMADKQWWQMNVAAVNSLLFVHFYTYWMTPFLKVQVRDS